MTLATAVKEAQKNNKTESTSGKNPSYYQKQKQQFIDDTCSSASIEVRAHAAGSEFTPVSNLKEMLKVEEDKAILSSLLMNLSVPVKSLNDFLDTERAELFTEDDEAYQHVLNRCGADVPFTEE